MLNFLFWNLQKKNRDTLVADLAKECSADVICLAECETVSDELLKLLSKGRNATFAENRPYEAGRVRVVSRFSDAELHPVFDSPNDRMTIWRLQLTGRDDFLLAVLHFQSKVHWEGEDQYDEAQVLANYIRSVETSEGHSRTVVFGDFNMNPFERGMVSSHGFHGVMTRLLASEGSRTVAGNEYPYLYNPMWGCLGDRTAGPAGSHFARISAPLSYFWNTFDQVLIRPALLHAFPGNVKLVDSIGGRSLISDNGKIDAEFGTDHLPLFFSLDLMK
jgi:hypothetical protein